MKLGLLNYATIIQVKNSYTKYNKKKNKTLINVRNYPTFQNCASVKRAVKPAPGFRNMYTRVTRLKNQRSTVAEQLNTASTSKQQQKP